MNEIIKIENLNNVVREMEDSFYDIPFGNSKFQIRNFVINSQHTPARAYRAIGLSASAKIRALKEALYGQKKEEIDIEEINEKIADPSVNKFEKRRLQLKLEKKLEDKRYTSKLVNDALHELSELYSAYKQLPAYTRENFEKEEKKHFQLKLKKQALGIQGSLESLDNMGENIKLLLNKPEVSIEELLNEPKVIEDEQKLIK